MNAEIITIGTELLLGEIINTNASFLASQLPLLGIDLYYINTVGDNKQRLIHLLNEAHKRSDIIITTGGLGPTEDDVTRQAIADFLNERISIDPDYVKKLETFFSKKKLYFSQNNIKQAGIIPSAIFIKNSSGTAPGWWIQKDGKIIITLPGPTSEMKQMWTNEVMPRLSKLFCKDILLSKTIKTFGLSESQLDELISPSLNSINPTVAVYAKYDGIYIRVTAKGKDKSHAELLIQQKEQEIKPLVKNFIWGFDEDLIENVVTNLLIQEKLTLATAESETGGLLVSTITRANQNQSFFKGGFVICSDEMLRLLGIDAKLIKQYGKISAKIAETMATRIRMLMNSNIGIGITGFISACNSVDERNGTIFIGINYFGKKYSFTKNYPGQTFQLKQRAVTASLFELRNILINGGKHASAN